MLMTVKEAGEAIGCEWKNVYYLVSMSFIEAVHVRGSVKIITESLEEFCAERENEKSNRKGVSGYNGQARCREIIANIRQNAIQTNERGSFDSMERRGCSVEFCTKRHNRLPRSKQHNIA